MFALGSVAPAVSTIAPQIVVYAFDNFIAVWLTQSSSRVVALTSLSTSEFPSPCLRNMFRTAAANPLVDLLR